MSYLMPTYARQPVNFVRGESSYLYDEQNRAYLDALTGIAVCGLGHCHPAITKAMQEQAETLVHTSNLFGIPWQEKAGELLCQAAGMEKVFFGNSGAEANECAIKLARLFAHKKGLTHPKIIVMQHAFHGRTLATVSATANPKAREGFYTLDDDFIRVPFNDVVAVEALASDKDVCAILVEPIQGEGGLHSPDAGYLKALEQLCHDNDWLFMLDEVQTGNGRTGKYFAYQHTDVRPDVLTTAKGLGNGFPVGACMVAGKATKLFGVGSHGSTYGGTPFGSRVVCAVYETLTPQVLQNAHDKGAAIRQAVQNRYADKGVTLRGVGMMIGIVLPENMDCSGIVAHALNQYRLILNVTGGNVIRLLPALNLSDADTDELITRLSALLDDVFAGEVGA
ncbi:aspartate aminotransferase family protein [Moraxella caviae]|uniref:Acetylornithine aminotransferase n=1 Tax=Moraxella caviae TaxID=34060 RepID=A0A1T0A2W4_9GAMM|nr:aspartate aminotransferase family protein [Moraxella caviae]OOR90073.1 aspartate aminotransferase family protein [Moraxella caviae]STZ14685.1 Acetylornithine aminotransferase [Moraxella caviae]VEW12895.1 Acetylornithine aminotransferase [Moraxella caviae]